MMERDHVRTATFVTGLALLLVLAACGTARAAEEAPGYIWWEGEDFAETNLPDPGHAYPGDITQAERDKLSGGTWLNPAGPASDTPYFIKYQVDVPAAGTHAFWVRKFWHHGPFRWRFGDEADWQECRRVALADTTNLRKFIGANWASLGDVTLEAGTHELHIEMLQPQGGGAFDCFMLIDGPFMPRGKLKPGEKSGHAMPGYFAWEPDADPLSDDCPIDLSYLNEEESGQGGFVRREGDGFVLGGGDPVRFWMVQGGGVMGADRQKVDATARRLAKYGVNMVRFQMSGLFGAWRSGDEERFRRSLDRLHYAVAALKREGIYVYLGHIWWHTSVRMSEADGFPGYGEGKPAVELLFFNPKMRDIYLRWVGALLNTENPYTGLPMSADPTVAFVEIQNESSLFFWTFRPDNIVPQTLELIEKAFGDWAAEKYGSVDAALVHWGPDRPPSGLTDLALDRPAEGRLGLYPVGHLTNNDWARNQRNAARGSDQMEFMTDWQMDFYKKMVADWREQLGVKNLITCSNWKTADPRTLGVLENYTYTAGDSVLNNIYFDVEYDPRPERFYAVDVGDTYSDRSALRHPHFPEPFTVAHMDGYPYMITENSWTRPNRFRTEWPFLVATYGTMLGIDGWCFFSWDGPEWTSQMGVWEVNSPSVLGQFPAAALLYRMGWVAEAPPALTDRLRLKDIYAYQEAALFEMSGRDALWDSRIGELEGATDQAAMQADRLSFFTGRVVRQITDDEPGVQMADLSNAIDRATSTVTSLTGQIRWNYAQGTITVDTPYAQGACGVLSAAGSIELGDLTIESGNEYGSILVVSLDGRPLAESGKVLIQAGTEDLPYGFATEPANGKKSISDLGGYPMNMVKVDASVTLKGDRARTAQVLSETGYEIGRTADTATTGAGLTVRLPEDSLYTLVE